METAFMQMLIELGKAFGLPGVILVLWYWDSRRQDDRISQMAEFQAETRRMYEDNVKLLETTQGLAESLLRQSEGQQDLIKLNIEKLSRVCNLVESNQYCPNVRINKLAIGPNK